MLKDELTLRDYLAIRILSGILANSEVEKSSQNARKAVSNDDYMNALVATSYDYADCIIKVRKND